MNYKEFVKTVRDVQPPVEMELMQAILWLHPDRLPLGVVSLGKDASGVIVIPSQAENRYGRTVPVIAVAISAFAGQGEITDVVLPASIDSLPAGAFAGCAKLKRLTIPKKIRAIKAGTFAGCTALKDIYYEGSPEDWNKIEIEHRNEPLVEANVHFHCNLDEALDPQCSTMKGRDVTGW